MSEMPDATEIFENLDRLDQAAQGDQVALAALASGDPMVNAWKDGIQGWPLIKSGTYRRSIHKQVFQEETTPDRAVVIVGTDIVDPPYPFFLEYGTSKMKPKPVGRQAFEGSKDEVQREFGVALMHLLQQAVR